MDGQDRQGVIQQRITGMIEHGVASMGHVFALWYRMPESCGMEQFLNSVKITLWRMALAPQYVWWIGDDGCCYLVLTIYGGYARKDVSDIDCIIQRLWHGTSPVTLLHWRLLDELTVPHISALPFAQISMSREITLPQHKRSFGATLR